MKKITIGIFGGGTVGGGIVAILSQQKSELKKQGLSFEIKKICVKNLNKKRDFELPKSTKIVTDFSEILNDESIELVIECIGGITKAKDIVFEAIEKGKHVVTSNKALISKYLPELEKLLNNHPKVQFGYEASVGGGIPIIHTIQRDLLGDNIQKISGIMNGTTNFILSKMENEDANYADVLKEAQDLGFAEADPTADVEGFDARSKIAILTKLAFGVTVDEETIFTQGITRITDSDFAYAKQLNGTIKILTIAEKTENDYSIYVSPMIVPKTNALAKISGATNAISIQSEFLKETVLVGQGAGRFPTANAVVSDILSIAQEIKTPAFPKTESLEKNDNIKCNFYIRFRIKDGLGIIRKIAEFCEKSKVSIDSILQLPIENPNNFPFVLTTNKTNLKAIEQICKLIEKEDFCLEKPLFMPIMNH